MNSSQNYFSKLSFQQKQWIKEGNFATHLLSWYDEHHRFLPWRTTHDPYKIWISEIVLQQTRVAQGMSYYKRIVATFPTVNDLAAASEQEILAIWQGLGYYRRALNLHSCSKKIVQEYNSQFPTSYQSLLKLPGIGPYTAAAIASIAFEERVAVVDGNVHRVLARIFGIRDNIEASATKKKFQIFAHSLLPIKRLGDYNQAVMEFGSLFCTPNKPSCQSCIFQNICIANQQSQQHLLPVKEKNIKIKHRFFHYLILQEENKFYVQKRQKEDIWKRLYQFYLIEEDKKKDLINLNDPIIDLIKCNLIKWKEYPVVYQHQLTHQRLHIIFTHVNVNNEQIEYIGPLMKEKQLQPYTLKELLQLPLPIVLARFVQKVLSNG
ncbi:MAG: A/G-specific adenine glycosylase [Bacteroidota bacterium]